MTPTVIRSKTIAKPSEDLLVQVITIMHSKGINAHFHVYAVFSDGSTNLRYSCLYTTEKAAIDAWEEFNLTGSLVIPL